MVECEHCHKPASYSTSHIDHISPICPVMISQKVMSFAMLIERTFCDKSNLQLLCQTCHKEKSKSELGERVKWRKKNKYLVVRHESGCKVTVISIVNLKELPGHLEVMSAHILKKDATFDMKRRKQLC